MSYSKTTLPSRTIGRPARRRETKRRGELAETAFLHRATELGFHVSKPYGDSDRYDFIVDNGRALLRVQVKSTSTVSNGLYHVNAGRRSTSGPVPYHPSQVDYLAIYVFPENTWYILPVTILAGRVSLLLYPRHHPKPGLYAPYREAWRLLR
jgi:hypothetical protein